MLSSAVASRRMILFDAAGTLIRPSPSVAGAYCQVAFRFGVNREIDEVSSRFRHAFSSHFDSATTNEDQERIRWRKVVGETLRLDQRQLELVFPALWDHFAQPQNWRLFDDVIETWDGLTRLGYRVGIASNFDDRLFPILAGLPRIRESQDVFSSSQIGFRKPQVEFFRHIELATGLSPSELVIVGDDSRADVQGGQNAGWMALQIDRTLDRIDGFQIGSLNDVMKVLQQTSVT